ncbi:hypothetical protein N7492_008545 [Penicillium capsulatum]|uniref:Phenylalanine ammonia-lyase n=1 Tax=Penicillium capsulatum TaxID=69766 RepID=A0A9W9LH69_9EURO|nr:hypothetical protein N7492_008545 [Penicillium capsulatum]KAJ6105950.1 hypothetical protein N7512_009467 [Penicillium capsulatum]
MGEDAEKNGENGVHSSTFTDVILSGLNEFARLAQDKGEIRLDGSSLDIASMNAVARCHARPALTRDLDVLKEVDGSVEFLNNQLRARNTVYGVTTGFGGSADTRTNDYETLQKALIQHHNSAVGSPLHTGNYHPSYGSSLNDLKSHIMPISTVRAAMLARCNSLLRGHSSVRVDVINRIVTMLARGLTPMVPLRGSISASGDLTPLAYIAGALEGNPDIMVFCDRAEAPAELIPADKALQKIGLNSISFGPKEGLGLMNGTAFSCGAASLVLFEANQLVLMSQLLTAMGTEAILGSRRNYHSFISKARPHVGQTEAAANIYDALGGSKLATDVGPGRGAELAQDRYAWRTAPQWIGPQLENMKLAMQQVQTELNSTTDNPIADVLNEEMYHGGNFQAVSVATAMEKTMSAMQMLGKMVFSQCSELINPTLNKGLPPNLSIDNPNVSFAFKGVDINMAAYMSELAYLARPVTNYVQSAEMHNQGLNSLALIASRYAGDTVELLSLMTASYLYVLCQALDLRALHLEFIKVAQPQIDEITSDLLHRSKGPAVQALATEAAQHSVWEELMSNWAQFSSKDLPERSLATVAASLGNLRYIVLGNTVFDDSATHSSSKLHVQEWMDRVDRVLVTSYATTRESFFVQTTTKEYLCKSSKILYTFVRDTLGVPIHRGVVDHPTYDSGEPAAGKKMIGTNINAIYSALRSGGFADILSECYAARSG